MTVTKSITFCVWKFERQIWNLARKLPERVKLPNRINHSYPYLLDDVRVLNDNALIPSNICMETRMVLVNNMKTPTNHLCSGKTSRKGIELLSEIDTCTVNSNLVSDVSRFVVIKNDNLLSDHGPITITLSMSDVNLNGLFACSQHLGSHAVICET